MIWQVARPYFTVGGNIRVAGTRLYNRGMDGVDLNDQLKSYYPSGRSGKKWWRKVLWYLLDVTICNSFLVEKLSPHSAFHRTRHTQLQFRIQLAKQLIGRFVGERGVQEQRDGAGRWRMCSHSPTCLVTFKPGLMEGRGRVYSVQGRADATPLAVEQRHTIYGCSRCGVNLCKGGCFLQYHTEMYYKKIIITTVKPVLTNTCIQRPPVSKTTSNFGPE